MGCRAVLAPDVVQVALSLERLADTAVARTITTPIGTRVLSVSLLSPWGQSNFVGASGITALTVTPRGHS